LKQVYQAYFINVNPYIIITFEDEEFLASVVEGHAIFRGERKDSTIGGICFLLETIPIRLDER
jgi:hypothetical protein